MSDSSTHGWIGGVVTSLVVGGLFAGVAFTMKPTSMPSSVATSTGGIVVQASADYISPLDKKVVTSSAVFPLDPTWFGGTTTSPAIKTVRAIVAVQIKDNLGQTFTHATSIGMLDPSHALVIANDGSNQALLSVTQDGQAQRLATLTSSTQPFLDSQGSICLKSVIH